MGHTVLFISARPYVSFQLYSEIMLLARPALAPVGISIPAILQVFFMEQIWMKKKKKFW